jgi:cell division protein FtsW (lipid II flippase)
MTIALLATTLGFATLISVQEVKSPSLIYGGLCAGVMVTLYFFVRLCLPHSDAILLPIATLLTGVGLLMIYRLTYGASVAENLAITQAVWILVESGVFAFMVLFFRNYQKVFTYKYLLAFLHFAYRGTKIALLAEDDASKLLAFGLTVLFAMQTLVIVGGVTKAIPLTGLTLLFVSYGGSSVIGSFILTALLLVFSAKAGKRFVEDEKQVSYTEETV